MIKGKRLMIIRGTVDAGIKYEIGWQENENSNL